MPRRLIEINAPFTNTKTMSVSREVISASRSIGNVRARRMTADTTRPVAISGVRVYGLTWATVLGRSPRLARPYITREDMTR